MFRLIVFAVTFIINLSTEQTKLSVWLSIPLTIIYYHIFMGMSTPFLNFRKIFSDNFMRFSSLFYFLYILYRNFIKKSSYFCCEKINKARPGMSMLGRSIRKDFDISSKSLRKGGSIEMICYFLNFFNISVIFFSSNAFPVHFSLFCFSSSNRIPFG